MDPEEIKPNHLYNLRLYFTRIDCDGDYIFSSLPSEPDAYYLSRDDVKESVYPLSTPYTPLNLPTMTRIPEPATKYDPCRLLRKGDKVQVKRRNGRCNGKDGEYLREAFCKVVEDETRNELVRVLHNATEYRLDPAYLELVEPVEELEPYSTNYNAESKSFEVRCGSPSRVCAAYYYGGEKPAYTKDAAKEAAEAERDRLNAEWKEQYEQAKSHE